MTTAKHIGTLYLVIMLLITTIVIMQCSGYNVKPVDEIIIPEKEGVLIDSLPKEVIMDTTYLYKFKDTLIKYYNPVDTIYIKEYIKASDTERANRYAEAISRRKYENVVEDSVVAIKYNAETEGKLIGITFDYKVKEHKFEIPKHKTEKLSMYLGGGLSTTTDLNNFEPVIKGGVQINNKGIFTIDYGITTKSVQAGYMFKIASFKK